MTSTPVRRIGERTDHHGAYPAASEGEESRAPTRATSGPLRARSNTGHIREEAAILGKHERDHADFALRRGQYEVETAGLDELEQHIRDGLWAWLSKRYD